MQLLRRWISEGARSDNVPVPEQKLTLHDVVFTPGKPVRIFCRVKTECYLTLTVRDPTRKSELFFDVAAVRAPKEQGDAGAPGELIHWDIAAGTAWPEKATAELTIRYAAAEARDTEFYAGTISDWHQTPAAPAQVEHGAH